MQSTIQKQQEGLCRIMPVMSIRRKCHILMFHVLYKHMYNYTYSYVLIQDGQTEI